MYVLLECFHNVCLILNAILLGTCLAQKEYYYCFLLEIKLFLISTYDIYSEILFLMCHPNFSTLIVMALAKCTLMGWP